MSRERLAHLIVFLVLTANAIALFPELSIGRADLNDNVFHFTLINRMAHVVERHGNPLDFWSPEWSFGYPVMRTYQPLSHLLVVSTYFLLGKTVSLMTLFLWARYLAVVLLPLSFFAAARLLTLKPLEAAAVALVAPFVSTNFLYGIEYGSFIWAGSGLYPQSISCHFLLLTLGFGFQAILRRRREALAGVLLGCTFLSHFIFGYVGAISLCLLAALPHQNLGFPVRAWRLAKIAAISFAISAFELIPLFHDGGLINHSRWEMTWKWDSFGASQVLRWLFNGELLDHGRLPVLSTLVLVGIVTLAAYWRRHRTLPPERLFVLSGAALWILIFFGRPFWGPALVLLGVHADMQLHRVIGAVHIFLVILAGFGLAAVWRALENRRQATIAVFITIALLYPLVRERSKLLANNRTWGIRNLEMLAQNRQSLDAVVSAVKDRGGRVYPGLAATWGGKFKIGDVPLYAFLSDREIPAVAYLYHSMALTSDIMVHFNEWSPAQYRLFNIRSVVAPSGTPLPAFLIPKSRIGTFQVFDAPGTGFFEVVDVPAAVQTNRYNFYDINLRWLQSTWPANHDHLWLNTSGYSDPALPRLSADEALPNPLAANPPGTVETENDNEEQYTATVDVARSSFVLFRMTWHPNWRAYVDGQLQRTGMLSPGFIGVPVTPGTHHVVLRYEPGPWKPLLLMCGVLVAVAIANVKEKSFAFPRVSIARVGQLIAAAALVLPVCVSLMSSRMPSGHDAMEYLPRQIEFHQNISQGIWVPQWAPDLVYGAGEPFFEFNPPMTYYLVEFWHLLGLNFVAATNAACVLLVVAAAVGIFLVARLYFGQWGGWLAAAAFLYSPYFAVNLYVRSALAEFAAFPFYVLALYGFGAYAALRKFGYLLLGALAYAGVMLSHNAAALIFTPLLIGFLCLTSIRGKSWRVLRNQFAGVFLGLGLSAYVWIPALAERKYVGLDRLLDGYLRYSNHFVFLHQLFDSPWGYGISVSGDQDRVSFALGWGHLLLLGIVLAFVLLYRKVENTHWIVFFTTSCVAFCFLMSWHSRWLWDHVQLLQYLQFPWRMLGPASVCMALVVAALAPLIQALPRFRRLAFAAALAVLIVPNLTHNRPNSYRDVDLNLWAPSAIASNGLNVTTASEYVPKWVKLWPAYSPDMIRIVSGEAVATQTARTVTSWNGFIRCLQPTTVDLSIAWFPGWEVRIDGAVVDSKPADPTGLIRFNVPAGDHRISVVWNRTFARRLGAALSLASVVSVAIFIVALVFIFVSERGSLPPRKVSVPSTAC